MNEPTHATLALTGEPSGEIRLALRLPVRSFKTTRQVMKPGYQAQDAPHLVYSEKFGEIEEKRAGYGGLPSDSSISKAGRRAIKNACGALKHRYGKHIVFATLTLAGSTDEARRSIACYSAKCVELLRKWICYHAPGSLAVYVWERQRSGALHLHAAIGSDNVLHLRALERQFKAYVYRLHEKLCALSGLDCFARAQGGSWKGFPEVIRSNCVPVRKCVKRYMSKYLSKGEGEVSGYSPSAWWGQTRALKALVGGLRCCTLLKSENWALLSQIACQVRQAVSQREYTMFGYSIPFSPSSYINLVYPPEAQAESAFKALDMILKDWQKCAN